MRRLGPALVFALTVTTSACSGHVADTSLAPGDRVRVNAPSLHLHKGVGTVAALKTDTLVVSTDNRADAPALPLSDVRKLEVHRGRKSWGAGGALIGLAVGVAAGVALSGCQDDNCGVAYAFAVPPAAVIGSGLGALIGSSIKVDRWVSVPLDEMRVGLSPVTSDGVAVSVVLRL